MEQNEKSISTFRVQEMMQGAGSVVHDNERAAGRSGFEAHLTRSLGGNFLEMETLDEAASSTSTGAENNEFKSGGEDVVRGLALSAEKHEAAVEAARLV